MWLIACSCDVLGGGKLQDVMRFTWCLCPFLTVIPSVIGPRCEQTFELEARNKKRILFSQPQIQEQIVEVPQILEQNVEVIKVILQEHCQQMRFFIFRACGEGAVGCTGRACCLTVPPHTRVLVDSECKRQNLEHVVPDLFSHFTVGKIQWLSVSCRGSGFCDLFQLFASIAQLFVAVDHVRSCQRRSGFRHPRGGAVAHQVLGSCAILEPRIGRQQRVENATRVGLQFPFRPERRALGAPSVAMKWRDAVKVLPPDVTLDAPYWWQPGMPLLPPADYMAPVPLKRSRRQIPRSEQKCAYPTRRSCASWTSTPIIIWCGSSSGRWHPTRSAGGTTVVHHC